MPEALLLPGEVVLFRVRRHPLTLLLPLALTFSAAIALSALACPTALELRLDGRCPLVVAFGLAVGSLPFLLDWLATRFVLTNFRLLRFWTPLGLHFESLRLTGIESLTVRQAFWGRLLGYGDVIADSTATLGNRIVLDTVADPQGLRDRIAATLARRVES